jgi:hypothetical protein
MRAGLCLLLWGVLSGTATAQSDTQLWTSAGAQLRPAKGIRVEVSQQVRFDQDISSLESVLPQISASWTARDWLRLGTGYRYTQERKKDDTFQPEHRVHIQGSLRGELGPVSTAGRLRLQERAEFGTVLETKRTVRWRVGTEVDTDTPFTPGLSLERFTELKDGKPIQEKRRWTAKVEIRPSKRNSISVSYRLQQSLEDSTDPNEHILGLDYMRRIKKRK